MVDEWDYERMRGEDDAIDADLDADLDADPGPAERQRGRLGDQPGQGGGRAAEAEALVPGLRGLRGQTPGTQEQEDADNLHRETDLCDGEDVRDKEIPQRK